MEGEQGERTSQERLRAHIAALVTKFGADQNVLGEWLDEDRKGRHALMKGDRALQPRHIAGIIRALRSEAEAPSFGKVGRQLRSNPSLSWGRADEYELMWLYMTGELPPDPMVENTDLQFLKGEFDFGGWKQEAVIYEFIPRGYDADRIHASFDETPFVPLANAAHREAFDRLVVEKAAQIEADPDAWNGGGATLSYIKASRSDGSELPYLTIGLKRSDYVRRAATRALFSRVLCDAERRMIIDDVREGVQESYCGGFGVVLSLISADRKLIFFQRSNKTAGDWGTYDCTVVEGMDGTRDIDQTGQPSMMRAALRALHEEAGFDEEKDGLQPHIRFHGVVCRSRFYEWALYGSVNLIGTALTAEAWAERAADRLRASGRPVELRYSASNLGSVFTLAQDAYEFQRYVAVDFNLPNVVRFIATNPLADYSFVSAVMTLRRVLNASPDAIARELRQYAQPKDA